MIARMLDRVGVTLDEVVEGLPAFHKAQVASSVRIDRKGAVMRAVTEAAEPARTPTSPRASACATTTAGRSCCPTRPSLRERLGGGATAGAARERSPSGSTWSSEPSPTAEGGARIAPWRRKPR